MVRLEWFGSSDRGKVRVANEDAFLGLRFDANEASLLGKFGESSLHFHDLLFAVSDGIGGAAAGEFASKIAVEKITRLMPRAFHQKAKGWETGAADVLAELYAQIHRALLLLGGSYEECRDMGATLSLCWFFPDWMYFAHIGDSRIYYLPASGQLRQLSHDDTYVGWMRRNGQLNEREARSHPRRHFLQKALGAGHQFVDPQIGAVGLEAGDAFLLCSDGVVDGLYDQAIEEVLRESLSGDSGRNPAAELVRAAVEHSGRDNTTAVVVRVIAEGAEALASKDASRDCVP
jgi:serine/threonine protein phosphatase PrpC